MNLSTWKSKQKVRRVKCKIGKKNEECEMEVYQDNDDIMRMTHSMTCAQHLQLEPMSIVTLI